MEPEDWTPVYLTEDERAEITAHLIMLAEERQIGQQENRARRLYYLAGLVTFATSPGVRVA